MGLDIRISRSSRSAKGTEVEDLAYFRKAQPILDWFDKKLIQETGKSYVESCYGEDVEISREWLEELLTICKEILRSIELMPAEKVVRYDLQTNECVTTTYYIIADSTVCDRCLPDHNRIGPYDESYFYMIRDAIEQFEPALAESNGAEQYFFEADW